MSTKNKVQNKELRLKIVEYIKVAKEGHIPSSLSIVDIINFLYKKKLRIKSYKDQNRDIFILSKGHGGMALYVVLNKVGYLKTSEVK